MTVVLRGARVRLRPWRDDDLPAFAALNADAEVMRHFVAPLTREQSDAFALRARASLDECGWGHWALEVPGIGFAGFAGLAGIPFELPGVDGGTREIGWRLARAAWGRGYATEAARLALAHAFGPLGWSRIVSFTALSNLPSVAVMRRIGLVELARFEHPRIACGHPIRPHVLYGSTVATHAQETRP